MCSCVHAEACMCAYVNFVKQSIMLLIYLLATLCAVGGSIDQCVPREGLRVYYTKSASQT